MSFTSGDIVGEWARGKLTTDFERVYAGFHKISEKWNGWYIPTFSKKMSERILSDLIGEGEYLSWIYDKDNDQFLLEEEDKSIIKYTGFDIEYGNKLHRVYMIGGYEWCWDRAE